METSQDIPDTETHHVKPEIGAEPHLDQIKIIEPNLGGFGDAALPAKNEQESLEISEDPNNDIADDECENVDTNDEEIPMVMDDPPSDTDERINMEEIISKLQGSPGGPGLCGRADPNVETELEPPTDNLEMEIQEPIEKLEEQYLKQVAENDEKVDEVVADEIAEAPEAATEEKAEATAEAPILPVGEDVPDIGGLFIFGPFRQCVELIKRRWFG